MYEGFKLGACLPTFASCADRYCLSGYGRGGTTMEEMLSMAKKVDGLVLSGRCISCEQGPFQSARSMAPAMAVGHASGCAAALAATRNVLPRKLDVKELQKLLLSQKAELRL